MPLLLALGLANVISTVMWNKKTIDDGDLNPKAWGYDARNVGILAGLGLTILASAVGIPLLAAAGLGVAASSYTNKDATRRLETGLRGWIKQDIDRQLAERIPPASEVLELPPPAELSPVPPPPPENVPAASAVLTAISPDLLAA